MRSTALIALLLPLLATSALAGSSWLAGQEAGGRFGNSVADAGDVNNDGWPDLLVGAPLDDTGGAERGRAFLFLGRPGGYSFLADHVFQGSVAGDRFGQAVAGVGDVNDDGFDDFAVGAPLNDQVAANAGEVQLFLGGNAISTAPAQTYFGEIADDNFGWALSRGGDLNNDSRDDWLVGAPGRQVGGVASLGKAYLFAGQNGGTPTTYERLFSGELARSGFGYSLGDIPNFRGDGRAGFAVGAPWQATGSGRAFLFIRPTTGFPTTTPTVSFTDTVLGEELGYALSQLGDFNNDGRTDIGIGAPGTQGDRGALRIFLGATSPPSVDSAANQEILGTTGGDRFGEAVADLGGHIGTSIDDFAVGAPLNDAGGLESGQIYVFRGGGSYSSAGQGTGVGPDNPTGTSLAGDHFGQSLSFVGDLNGDGDTEILIGAPDANRADNGVHGVASIYSTVGGSLSLAVITLDSDELSSDQLRLHFAPIGSGVDRAELLLSPDAPTALRELGNGVWSEAGGLTTEIHRAELEGESEVWLRWQEDGLVRLERFSLTILPSQIWLAAPQPNPVEANSQIAFRMPRAGAWSLEMVDMRGRLVRTWTGESAAGEQLVFFDGRDAQGKTVARGSYHLRLSAAGQVRSRTLLMVAR